MFKLKYKKYQLTRLLRIQPWWLSGLIPVLQIQVASGRLGPRFESHSGLQYRSLETIVICYEVHKYEGLFLGNWVMFTDFGHIHLVILIRSSE